MSDPEDDRPLTVDRLKLMVGADVYDQARQEAWELAPGTGSRVTYERTQREYRAFNEVMAEVSYHTWTVTDREIQRFFFDLYREMPAYGILFEFSITLPYRELSPDLKDVYWQFFREMLESPEDALADPVGYVLWCDFFEEPDLVEKAWSSLISGNPNDKLIERVLVTSGPVPFQLKRGLYSRLMDHTRWHYFIYRGLLHSQFDVYGKLDRDEARKILAELDLDLPEDEKEDYRRLTAALTHEA
jgi:hypothetical protein